MNWIRNLSCIVAMTASLSIVLTGCTPSKDAKKDSTAKKDQKKAEPHPEKGPHGGPLAEWGDDDYHVEFTVDTAAKSAVVYILDGTAKAAPKIDAAKITDVKLTVKDPKVEMDLKYDAKRSDAKGIAFVGANDAFAKAGDYKGTISGKVDGKPFAGEFPLKVD